MKIFIRRSTDTKVEGSVELFFLPGKQIFDVKRNLDLLPERDLLPHIFISVKRKMFIIQYFLFFRDEL